MVKVQMNQSLLEMSTEAVKFRGNSLAFLAILFEKINDYLYWNQYNKSIYNLMYSNMWL